MRIFSIFLNAYFKYTKFVCSPILNFALWYKMLVVKFRLITTTVILRATRSNFDKKKTTDIHVFG